MREMKQNEINSLLRFFYLYLRVNAKNLPNFNFLAAEKVTYKEMSEIGVESNDEDVRQRRKLKRDFCGDLSIKREIVTVKKLMGKEGIRGCSKIT